MLSLDDKLKLLRINSFVGESAAEFLSAVALLADERAFDKGRLVYTRDEPAGAFYLLIEGRVSHPELPADLDPNARQVSAAGQMFGFGASSMERRLLSARCEQPTRLLALDAQDFRALCEQHGLGALAQRLASVHAGYERHALGRSGWISVRNAGKSFKVAGAQARLLDDCSFEMRPGELWAVFGPKDRGKTVLLNLIAGFDSLSEGVIYLDGLVVNRPGSLPRPGPEHIVGSNPAVHAMRSYVEEYLAIGERSGAQLSARSREVCARLGLGGFLSLRLRDVPQDMVRRVEIVRAFLNDPYVVLDEPARDLAGAAKAALLDFVQQARALLPKTTIFATEDVDDAIQIADGVLVMAPPGTRKTPVAIDLPHPRTAGLRETLAFQRLRHAVLGALDASPPARVELRTTPDDDDGLDEAARARQLAPRTNALKEAIHEGRFFWTVEFIPSIDKVLHDALHQLGGVAELVRQEPELVSFSVTDRVVSDRDPDPVPPAARLLQASGKQPLVHYSGKGRDIGELPAFIERLGGHGLENVLFLTGDRLKEEPADGRARYLESVPAIQAARRLMPGLLIAAALNPFKYREEDAMAQYLKLGKKVGAGADFVITQIGFDMHKYEEALFWVGTRNYRVPLVANLLPMSAARARYLRAHQLAGVTITDSFLCLLEAEERSLPDKGAARVLRRLALQILGVRYYGYAGVQLTGIHSALKLHALRAELATLAELCSDRITWNKAWDEALTLPEGGRANPAPARDPWYLVNRRTQRALPAERAKARAMDTVHTFAFDRGLLARWVKPALAPIARTSRAGRVLERVERAIKAPLFGCETCGMCRLAATQYVCPETCPKGLANGACGGTTENLCEFRDRECIHSAKYRIANDLDISDQLEKWLIPAVPEAIRNTSSWPPHFRGEGPAVEVVDFLHPEDRQVRGW